MDYDRTWAISYLQDEYATIASKARVAATDTSDGYKSVLDNALSLIGFTDDELENAVVGNTDDVLVYNYKQLLKYFALNKYYTNFSVQSDTTFTNPGINEKKSIFFKNLENLLNKAASTVTALGFDIGASNDEWQESILYYAY